METASRYRPKNLQAGQALWTMRVPAQSTLCVVYEFHLHNIYGHSIGRATGSARVVASHSSRAPTAVSASANGTMK